jgi:hypothetical protein
LVELAALSKGGATEAELLDVQWILKNYIGTNIHATTICYTGITIPNISIGSTMGDKGK